MWSRILPYLVSKPLLIAVAALIAFLVIDNTLIDRYREWSIKRDAATVQEAIVERNETTEAGRRDIEEQADKARNDSDNSFIRQ